MPKYIIYIGD